MNEVITISFTVADLGWLLFCLGIIAIIVYVVKIAKYERKQEREFKNKIYRLNKKMECLR